LELPATRPRRNPEDADALSPYWESDHGRGPDAPGWGRVPPPLRPGLLGLPPLAVLPRARVASLDGATGKATALTRLIHGLIDPLLVDAGLRDLPFAGKDKAEEAKAEADKPDGEGAAAPPFEIGWLVHNSGAVDDLDAGVRLTAITTALKQFGCEIDPIGEGDNVSVRGDSGAARGALMLAEALIRTAQLQKPALLAEFDASGVGVGMTCPPPETNA